MGLKRVFVVLSLAGYLLAATAIHALHDHSGAGHCAHTEQSCELGGFHQTHDDGCSDCHGSSSGHHSNDCEDSCFACRFVAAKSILPTVVLAVERFETVCQIEPSQPVLAPVIELECSLCRGPPTAC